MDSIRKKFYIAYLLITTAGAFGFRQYTEKFKDLPSFYGIDIYGFLLGLVFLIISAALLEYFVFSRVQSIKKKIEQMNQEGFAKKEKLIDLSEKDEIGQIVNGINNALECMEKDSQKLKHKNTLYLSLVEDPSIYVYRFKEDGTITFVNSSYANLVGKEYKKMLHTSIYDHIEKPGLLKEKLSYLNPTYPSINIAIDTPKLIHQHTPKWITWNASGVFDEQGKISEYQVVGINMHHTNKDLSNKELSYDSIFLLNLDGKIAYSSSNKEYENMVGEIFLDYIHPDDLNSYIKSYKKVVANKDYDVRNIRIRKGIEYIASQVLIESVVDKDEEVSSVSIKTIDISNIEGAQAKVVGAFNNMNRLLERQTRGF